jgi:hypothetical protein
MATTLQIKSGWAHSRTNRTRSVAATATTSTLTGDGVTDTVQTIGFAAHEAIVLTDISTYGYAEFTNLDATNFVQIGIDETGTFHPLVKLEAGQSARLWLSEAPYAQADTAACDLACFVTER